MYFALKVAIEDSMAIFEKGRLRKRVRRYAAVVMELHANFRGILK
jgi:hypothetical protein